MTDEIETAPVGVAPEALPNLQFADYKLVPHPEDPSKQLVIHIAPTAITAWHRPTLVGVFEEEVNQQPAKTESGAPSGVRLQGDKWLKINFEGLPETNDRDGLSALEAKIRDGVERDHPDWITFKK